tara:strand:- start:462 stop:725 length:264 start_codon:yes stop_codon:yes gene_type:complete
LNIYDFELKKLVKEKLISVVDMNKFLGQTIWRTIDDEIYYFVIKEKYAKTTSLTLQSYNFNISNEKVLAQEYKPSKVVIKGISHSTD